MKKAFMLFLVVLLILSMFAGCKKEAPQETTLEKSLQPFLNALEEYDLCGMTLTMYDIGPILTHAPITVEELISIVESSDSSRKVTLDSADLKKCANALSQIRAENFELADGLKREDTRQYYVFETAEHGKLLEIIEYGFSNEPYIFDGKEIDLTVFVNGFEVKYNQVLHDLTETLWSYADTMEAA